MDEVQFLAGRVVTAGYQPQRLSEELLAKAYGALDAQQLDIPAGRDSVQADLEASCLASHGEEAGR